MSEQIKIMIVDDEERFLETLTRRLSMRDFDVTSFTNGEEALKAAEKRSFDLALLDLKMPGLSGEEVLQALKKRHPCLEVIILTGHGSIDSAVKTTQLGSYAYLQKPCDTEELLRALRDAYQKRVQKKMELDKEQVDQLLNLANGESPLGILRKLRKLERERG